jgi:hypothetical protein
VGTGVKEEESSTGRVWTAVFHYVMAPSLLARVLIFTKPYSLIFLFFGGTADTESVDMGARLYYYEHKVRMRGFKFAQLG